MKNKNSMIWILKGIYLPYFTLQDKAWSFFVSFTDFIEHLWNLLETKTEPIRGSSLFPATLWTFFLSYMLVEIAFVPEVQLKSMQNLHVLQALSVCFLLIQLFMYEYLALDDALCME